MLLEFKTKNFKSFRDEVSFSMYAAPKQRDLSYSLLTGKGSRRKVLCSSVVYGANAAGKTSLIAALDVLKAIVLRGNINDFQQNSFDYAVGVLGLIPNKDLPRREPVEFYIDFQEKDYRVQYSLKLDLGFFLEKDYHRRIQEEKLLIDGNLIFNRTDCLRLGNSKDILCYIESPAIKGENVLETLGQNSLNDTELFLTSGFKILISQTFARMIIEWFETKLIVIYRANTVELLAPTENHAADMPMIDRDLNDAARIFGTLDNRLAFLSPEKGAPAKLFSMITTPQSRKQVPILAQAFESYGTLRFFNLFPMVLDALLHGGTLVADEFDASIHPQALMNIITIFHNDAVNTSGGQLIFNTHNPIFLNGNLFRRDEIKFVERDESDYTSCLYSLADFGTSGDKGVRKGEDYMKNYFISRYGAIRNIDFTPVIEQIRAEVPNAQGTQKIM